MRHVWLAAAAAASLLAGPAARAAPADPAATAADGWLAQVDARDYARSWAEAGRLFHNGVSESGWASMAAKARDPLGAVTARRLASRQSRASMLGAPDGDYEVLTFDTSFAHKQQAVETVVLERETGGWKVDGYFIR